MKPTEWTTPADLRRQVQRHWDSGRLLAAAIQGEPLSEPRPSGRGSPLQEPLSEPQRAALWASRGPLLFQEPQSEPRSEPRPSGRGPLLFPLELRLRGPDSRALSERFEEVRQWIRELENESRCQIEWREINHRLLGRNRVPARIAVPGEREALELIGKTDDAARFRSLAASTLEKLPELGAWLARRPLAALVCAADWDRILAVLLWFRGHPRSGLYLRQLDIAGVDTKFIEVRKPLLAELLDIVLPPEALGDSGAAGAAGQRT